jgi:hypothetical protein
VGREAEKDFGNASQPIRLPAKKFREDDDDFFDLQAMAGQRDKRINRQSSLSQKGVKKIKQQSISKQQQRQHKSIHNLNNTYEYKTGTLAVNQNEVNIGGYINDQIQGNNSIIVKPQGVVTHQPNFFNPRTNKINNHYPNKSMGVNQYKVINP